MPSNAPFWPSITSRRSLSLPTQAMTKSWPAAASFGGRAALPPCCGTHLSALAAGGCVPGAAGAPRALEVARHREPHPAEPDKRDLRHPVLPGGPLGPQHVLADLLAREN